MKLFWKKSKTEDSCESQKNYKDLCESYTQVLEDLQQKLSNQKNRTDAWHRECRTNELKIVELNSNIAGTAPLIQRLYKEAYHDTTTINNLRLLVDSRELESIRLLQHIKELEQTIKENYGK